MESQHAVLADLQTGLLVDGAWREGGDGTFAVRDPATGQSIAEVARASQDDVRSVLRSAARAQLEFATSSPRSRGDVLMAAYGLVMAQEERLARLITWEMGKPLEESRGEVRYAADFLRWFGEEAPRIGGEYRLLPDGRSRMIVNPRPVGACVLITPWNFPLAMATRKIAPAVAAGCVSILKPGEDTPLTSLAFAQILLEAGLPPGVLSVLTTDRPADLVRSLLSDRRTRKLSFTGSTGVGRTLLREAAHNVLRTSMELGGNAPFVVFADADIDDAVDGLMTAKFRNGGQACTAANRVFVQDDVRADFSAALLERVAAITMGHGFEPDTTLGPLIHDRAAHRVQAVVDDAVQSGATLVTGGRAGDSAGSFFEPTILDQVPDEAIAFTDEMFAPVISMTSFRTEDELVVRANDTDFGLVAYAYTADAERQFRLSDRLQYGMVAINRGLVSNAAAPFGGVKQSGLGREGSHEGLDEYLDYVYTAFNA